MAGKEGAAEENGEVLVGVEKEVVVDRKVKEEQEEEARRRGRPASRCRLRGAIGRQAILLWKMFRF